MAIRILTENSALVVIDTTDETNPLLYLPKYQTWYKEENLDQDLVMFFGTTSTNEDNVKMYSRFDSSFKGFDLNECIDGNNSDIGFTKESFRVWCSLNLVTSDSGGGSGSGQSANRVSTLNSSTIPLTASSNFTGTWEDVSEYNSVIVAATTDQDGTYHVQFSPDGVNIDSSLTKYYRIGQINAPHRFTIARSYCRIVFENTSVADQTELRLQTTFGTKTELNAPLDGTVAQDFDATITRPTDFHSEVALNLRQGVTTVNKFGYNLNVNTIQEEVIASFGGTFDPTTDIMTVAQSFTVTFNSSTDGIGNTGALSLLIDYIDGNFELQQAIHVLGPSGSDLTAFTGLGINRIVVLSNGGAGFNNNTITFTATTDGTTQAEIPAESSVTQQCIYHTPINQNFLLEWLYFSPSGASGGFFPTSAKLNIKLYSWSRVTSTRYDVANLYLDAGSPNDPITTLVPFQIGGREVLYATVTTDTAGTEVSGRFSGELYKNIDA